mmetsp:Transcript_123588/g.349978  ORF Transcript_123588/g.349978 Transcript_123588/m.349978 type:complete len:476 (-) Transcript_123588:184-1611(-)
MFRLALSWLGVAAPLRLAWGIAVQPAGGGRGQCSGEDTLCIDFGSSGAKISDCKGDAKDPKFPADGAGAFANMAKWTVPAIETKLGDYLKKHKLPMVKDKTCVLVCGGTAGNRFRALAGADEESWRKFNEALGSFASGAECKTFSGTEEASFEWEFTKRNSVFVGVGGASMQLHLPAATTKCPGLKHGEHFDGGVGAKDAGDFCSPDGENTGTLWSFLADRAFNDEEPKSTLHVMGGMNEVAYRYYGILVQKGMLDASAIQNDPTGWAMDVIRATALADPMWVAMLRSFHNGQCRKLPGPESITLLANPDLGRRKLQEPWQKLFQGGGATANSFSAGAMRAIVRFVFKPRRLHTQSDLLFRVLHGMRELDNFGEIAANVAHGCAGAVEQARTEFHDKKTNYFAEFDSNWLNKPGFVCLVKLFALSWLSTLAGLRDGGIPEDTAGQDCFKSNFQKLLTATKAKGDWMSGAIAKQGR